MNRAEYNSNLNAIEKWLQKNTDLDLIIQDLKTLYDYKPVSLQWHKLMCKALLQSGQAEKVISDYLSFINKDSLINDNLEIWRDVSEAYFQMGNILECKRYQYMLSKLVKTELFLQIKEELNNVKDILIKGDDSKEVLLHLEKLPKPDDAADAIAIALCHARSSTSLLAQFTQK